MALACLAFMPPELQLLTYSEFHPQDLLSISHVSKFWRSLALEDKRWNEWFNLISTDDETAEAFLSRYRVLDLIPKRAIVTLCFYTKCLECAGYTTDIFLPLLQRICANCRRNKKYAVMSLSSGLTTYDLKDRDIGDLLVLNWEETDPAKKRGLGIFYRAKLISQPALKEIAIKKHGSEANLATHLQRKRATLLAAHQQRVADYETAIAERQQLLNEGDTSAAAAVTMGPTKKKIPKSRPAIPAMLNGSGTPPFYQTFAIFRGGFLSVENGVVSHDKLVRCMLCVMMEKLRDDDCKARGDSFEFIDPGFMPPTVLDAHKEAAHYDREEEECFDGCADDGDSEGRCRICFNASAVWLNHEFGGL